MVSQTEINQYADVRVNISTGDDITMSKDLGTAIRELKHEARYSKDGKVEVNAVGADGQLTDRTERVSLDVAEERLLAQAKHNVENGAHLHPEHAHAAAPAAQPAPVKYSNDPNDMSAFLAAAREGTTPAPATTHHVDATKVDFSKMSQGLDNSFAKIEAAQKTHQGHAGGATVSEGEGLTVNGEHVDTHQTGNLKARTVPHGGGGDKGTIRTIQ